MPCPDRPHAGNMTLFGKAITDSFARILAPNGPGAVGAHVVGQGLVSANLAPGQPLDRCGSSRCASKMKIRTSTKKEVHGVLASAPYTHHGLGLASGRGAHTCRQILAFVSGSTNGANGADLVEIGTRDHAFKGSPTSKVNVSADNPKKSIACGSTARCGEHFSSFV